MEPPVIIEFPAASLACKVTKTLDPEATEAALTLMIELTGEMTPGTTKTVGRAVEILVPLTEARIEVAVPARTPVKFEV